MIEVQEFRVKVRFSADEPYTIGIYRKDDSGEHSEVIEYPSLEEALIAIEKLRQMIMNSAIDPYMV